MAHIHRRQFLVWLPLVSTSCGGSAVTEPDSKPDTVPNVPEDKVPEDKVPIDKNNDQELEQPPFPDWRYYLIEEQLVTIDRIADISARFPSGLNRVISQNAQGKFSITDTHGRKIYVDANGFFYLPYGQELILKVGTAGTQLTLDRYGDGDPSAYQSIADPFISSVIAGTGGRSVDIGVVDKDGRRSGYSVEAGVFTVHQQGTSDRQTTTVALDQDNGQHRYALAPQSGLDSQASPSLSYSPLHPMPTAAPAFSELGIDTDHLDDQTAPTILGAYFLTAIKLIFYFFR